MLKEKKNNNKELFLKISLLLASNWPSQFCWSFWLQPTHGAYPSSFLFLTSTPAASSPAQPSSSSQTHRFRHSPFLELWVHAGPSVVCTLLGASYTQRPSEVHTFPGASNLGLMPYHHPCGSTGRPGEEETGAAVAADFPKLPPSVFFSF